MSKAQLKKELLGLDKDQLIQLVLDAYSARKEIKQYLDFFTNPDVDSLYEKYTNAIQKEMIRGKYRRSTARLSKVKTWIKEFASFGIDPETVVKLSIFALEAGMQVESIKYVNRTFLNGMIAIAKNTLKFADKNNCFNIAAQQINRLLDGHLGTRSFVNSMRYELELPSLDTRTRNL